jgi:hypothetical protein
VRRGEKSAVATDRDDEIDARLVSAVEVVVEYGVGSELGEHVAHFGDRFFVVAVAGEHSLHRRIVRLEEARDARVVLLLDVLRVAGPLDEDEDAHG